MEVRHTRTHNLIRVLRAVTASALRFYKFRHRTTRGRGSRSFPRRQLVPRLVGTRGSRGEESVEEGGCLGFVERVRLLDVHPHGAAPAALTPRYIGQDIASVVLLDQHAVRHKRGLDDPAFDGASRLGRVEDTSESAQRGSGRRLGYWVRDAVHLSEHLGEDVQVLPPIEGGVLEDVGLGTPRTTRRSVDVIQSLGGVVDSRQRYDLLAVGYILAAVPASHW